MNSLFVLRPNITLYFQISQTSALNLALGVKTKSMKTNEAENLLNRMVEDKWLREAEDGAKIRLAPRFVAEMSPYLVEVHDDVLQNCHLCKKLVVKVRAVQLAFAQ